LKSLKGILPWLVENATKSVQLDAIYLMAKVHMKLAALKLDKAPSAGEMEDQEESKIADEIDTSAYATYSEAFYA
jgi:hypothetical protein